MKFCSNPASFLLVANFVLAADISEFVISPNSIAPLFDVDALPRSIPRRQKRSEICKVYPGDKNWPSDSEWSALNKTVGGALIKPVPRAAVCHSNWPQYYDPAKCTDLMANYNNHERRVADPTDLIYVYFQGLSCLPSTDPTTPCTTGGDPSYVVNVTTPEQISTVIKFAAKKKIRLIIKNTGHDTGGKSTGEGSLSIWTHNMKTIQWLPKYTTKYYTGPALKVGAGVSLDEFYQAADNHDVTVVGGECSTVGVAGGYSAGGGHSPVGGLFGMGADNIVELTAVLPNGTHITATTGSNPELFWAFRGGGGATFGVVTSITVKARPKIHVTISTWSFGTAANNITNSTFWQAARVYLEHVTTIADSGSQAFAQIRPATGGLTFSMTSFVAPNKTVAEYDTLMAPFFSKILTLGISVTQNTTFHPSFLGGWQRAFPKISQPWNPEKQVVASGSRLIPRKNFEQPKLFNQTFSTLQNIVDLGYGFIFYAQKNEAHAGVDNAINPAYRKSAVFLILSGSYPQNASAVEVNVVRDQVTKVIVPILKAVTPGSGTYMNEADIREEGWQQSFFGSNYARLLKLKKEVDPNSIFWAKTAVGSENWYIQNDHGLPEVGTGRLCRKL
ncbi:isoamyl alcohol oxidase-like protein [Melanomma pulvis-pyrius CBS 109.77]|uniref:Isoamyl alcohol oxidase-like protein n=1 Tax=Melanomma pulvis-pyrius CBS 109.77 TaxID=1314802 RepID=A0A6A6XJG7_9PLEO|nr:isoamyl alcohol oxidase-like protein [Melanomma pulvis-pyrius CBS 109.77]